MRARMGAPEHQAEQTWTYHQGLLLDEMNSAACDALENERRSLLRQNFKGANGKITDATCLKFNKKSKSNRLPVSYGRIELSESVYDKQIQFIRKFIRT